METPLHRRPQPPLEASSGRSGRLKARCPSRSETSLRALEAVPSSLQPGFGSPFLKPLLKRTETLTRPPKDALHLSFGLPAQPVQPLSSSENLPRGTREAGENDPKVTIRSNQPNLEGSGQARLEPGHRSFGLGSPRDRTFSGGRGGRDPHVGYEIDQGGIRFMADPGDDGRLARRHGASHHRFVEGVEIFEAAPTPNEEDDIALGFQSPQSSNETLDRPDPLDRRRRENQMDSRISPQRRPEHVPKRRPAPRGHHPDRPRIGGKSPTPSRIGQPFALEFGHASSKGEQECPLTERLEPFGHELEASSGLEDRNLAAEENVKPLLEGKGKAADMKRRHEDRDPSPAIGEVEVGVAARRLDPQAPDLALHLHPTKLPFELLANALGQLADAEAPRGRRRLRASS